MSKKKKNNFKNIVREEEKLENLIMDNYQFLNTDDSKIVGLWSQQMHINAGIPDLIFIDNNSIPVIVEVKLWKNSESRRKIIGQILDYASYFSELADINSDEKLELLAEEALSDISKQADFKKELIKNLKEKKYRLVLAFDKLNLDELPVRLNYELKKRLNNKYHLLRMLKYINRILKSDNHASQKIELFEISDKTVNVLCENKPINIHNQLEKYNQNKKIKDIPVDLLTIEDLKVFHKQERSLSWELFEDIKRQLSRQDINFVPYKYKDNHQVLLFHKKKKFAFLSFYKSKRIIQLRIPLSINDLNFDENFKNKNMSKMEPNRLENHFKELLSINDDMQGTIIMNCNNVEKLVDAIKLAIKKLNFYKGGNYANKIHMA